MYQKLTGKMSNFFAALGDSDNEDDKPKIAPKSSSKNSSKSLLVAPSKVDKKAQYNHDHGDRHTKGGRGHRGGGKRQFDRRSGTGRGKDVKKDGGGGRNWGNDKNEARKNEGPIDESQFEKKTEVTEAPGGEENTLRKPEEIEPEPEPEDNTMSYEEYLATKGKPDSGVFAETKVREVENEFAGVTIQGKDDEEDFLVMGDEKRKRTRQKKNEKKTIDMSFRVVDSSAIDGDSRGGRRDSGRGGRGGRSGGRGGGRGGKGGRSGRGRGRGGRGRPINTTDPEAFPSL